MRERNRTKMMSEENDWLKRAAGQLIALTWPLYAKIHDYRAACLGDTKDPTLFQDKGDRVIYSFWHEFLVALVPKWANSRVTFLVSQHRDGEWINQIATALGYGTARGSSTRGGAGGLRQMKKAAEKHSLGVTPDGPRGPRRKMSQGAVYLGSKLQLPIVPVGVGIRDYWQLDTWDNAPIPKPFSPIRIIFGEKIILPGDATRDFLEQSQVRLQAAMDEVNSLAQDWADGKVRLSGYVPQACRKSA